MAGSLIPSGNMRRTAGVIVALSALAGMGVLSVMAAPSGSPSPKTATNAPALLSGNTTSAASQRPQGPVVAVKVAATTAPQPTATATTAPQPTATPVPPAPTATPVPPPSPTATPAPSWHTVGNYSGSAPLTLPSFTTAYPWRMDWTCTPGSGATEAYTFNMQADGTAFAGFGDICTTTLPTSGVFGPCQPGGQTSFPCDASHTYSIVASAGGSYPMCAWTATIEEWY